MKKILSISIATILLVFCSIPAFAAGSFKVGISGNTTIRPNDTVTYNITVDNISGVSGGIAGIQGEIVFDSSVMSYQKYASKLGNDWQLELNPSGNKIIFIAYDNTAGSKTISKKSTIFTLTFKVSSSAKTGAKAQFSIANTSGTDGELNTASVSGGSLTATVAAPLSTNNLLSTLSVDKEGMTPAFSKNTTSYSMTVPYDVSSVKVNATPEDSKASVTISGNTSLKPEQVNEVKVTVKAESGATRVYSIKITRERDPDKPLSGNNNLSSISIDKSILSPVFSEEITNYVVWLPYEVDALTLSGTAIDSTASVEVVGGSDLKAGQDNEISIIVTAEDGSQKQYMVIAKRAEAHDSETQTETVTDGDITDTEVDTGETVETSGTETSYDPVVGSSPSSSRLLGYILVTGLLAGLIGFLAGHFLKVKGWTRY